MTNCIGFFGVMSSGKDVLGTKFLRYCLSNKKRRVIANCWLKVPNFTRLTNDELYLKHKDAEFFRNSYLYITELHTILESRSSNALVNKNFTMFLTQIGKINCKVIYTSQLEGQIDLRMRAWTPYRFITEKYVFRDGTFRQPDFFDDRKLNEPIFIKIILNYTTIQGEDIFKELGMYEADKIDFSVFDTEEIITLDREKFMRK